MQKQKKGKQTDPNDFLKTITIPSCPTILQALIAELRSPDSDNKAVIELIEQDVGLAALVIKAANSPLFGLKRHIHSISDAVLLLGLNTLNNLVYQALLRSNLGSTDTSLDSFWNHSSLSATVCSKLATFLDYSDADMAYTFGLFHDCGIPMLMQHFKDYKLILAQASSDPEHSFTAIEEAALKTNHAVVGSLLTRTWGLSEIISTGILCHHDYSVLIDSQGLPDRSRTLIAICALADHIVEYYLHLQSGTEWFKCRDAVSAYLGQTQAELDDLTDELLAWLNEQHDEIA